MPGALTHILVAILGALAVHFYHFKLEYSLAFFTGHLLPDAIKFGFTAIKQLTLNIFYVEYDEFFYFLAKITSDYTNWLTLGFFVFGLTALLYHFHVIKKKTMEEYDELFLFLLLGIITHLLLDVLIQERSPWI